MDEVLDEQLGALVSEEVDPEAQAAGAPSDQARTEEDAKPEEPRENRQQVANGQPGAGSPELGQPAADRLDEESLAADDGFEEGLEFDGNPREAEETEQHDEGLAPHGRSLSEAEAPTARGCPGDCLAAPEVIVADEWGARDGQADGEEREADPTIELEEEVYEASLEHISRAQLQGDPEIVRNQSVNTSAEESQQLHGDSEQQLRLQDLLENVQQENANLLSTVTSLSREKASLFRTVKEMEEKVLSSSQHSISLQRELDALRDKELHGDDTGQTTYYSQDMATEDRTQIAEEEAAMARSQLMMLLEKYKRVEKDNQAMADEIHLFREEIGRLRQCPSRASGYRAKFITLGLVFLFAIFYFWCFSEDYVMP